MHLELFIVRSHGLELRPEGGGRVHLDAFLTSS